MAEPRQAPTPPDTTRRGLLRAWLETRGFVGDFQRPHVDVELRAADGVRLGATYLAGPAADAPAVALLHGFAAHRRKPSYAYLADVVAGHAHVLVVDQRGHGRSGGVSTLGDREWQDGAAAVSWLRAQGHRCVVLIGVSMGGTATLHALHRGVAVDAAAAISTPGWLREQPDTAPMIALHELWTNPVKRRLLHLVAGVEVVPPERWTAPPHPADAAATAAVPLLVVHGEDDHYFPVSDAQAIADGAPSSRLWREPAGFGHAEDGFSPAFAAALARAVTDVVTTGIWPARGMS